MNDGSRRALRHEVRDGIVRAIIHGEVAPGERLIEMRIAREYGTSQAPVREALRELELLGFVRSERHRGTYVRDTWARGMLELYEVRAALEEHAARLATPALRADVSTLQAEVDAMAAAGARDDVRAAVEASERFHRIILEASGNQLLLNVWNGLAITDHTELTMVTLEMDPRTLSASHQPIVDAIASGDVEAACRVSREHQDWFERLLDEEANTDAGHARDAAD